MRIVFLNSPVVTAPGLWLWEPVKVAEQVQKFLVDHHDAERFSAVGHEATAKAMSELLLTPVPFNRATWRAEIGDVAIIFRIAGARLEEGQTMGREQLEARGYELGFLRYIGPPEHGRESLNEPWVNDADVIECFRMVW